MATEVLRPHDCLIGSHQRYPRRGVSTHARINRKGKVGQPEISSVVKSTPVTILRRGEPLDGRSKVGQMGMNRVGRNMGDVYAGSAFLSTSPPPPSSLPLPSFTSKKLSSSEGEGVLMVVVDDSASRDLRRLLRLE